MEVLIDGIRYVPAADIPTPTEESVLRAVQALTSALHLYCGSGVDRGTRGCIWDALEALSPDLHALAGEDPAAAYDACRFDWGST